MQGSVLFIGLYMFMHEKGPTTLSETDFCKIMEFLADYLKMIKLYEKIFCDSGTHLKGCLISLRQGDSIGTGGTAYRSLRSLLPLLHSASVHMDKSEKRCGVTKDQLSFLYIWAIF